MGVYKLGHIDTSAAITENAHIFIGILILEELFLVILDNSRPVRFSEHSFRIVIDKPNYTLQESIEARIREIALERPSTHRNINNNEAFSYNRLE